MNGAPVYGRGLDGPPKRDAALRIILRATPPQIFCIHNPFTNSDLTAFSTHSTMTPTSAKIASHIFATPIAPSTRHRNLTPMAK